MSLDETNHGKLVEAILRERYPPLYSSRNQRVSTSQPMIVKQYVTSRGENRAASRDGDTATRSGLLPCDGERLMTRDVDRFVEELQVPHSDALPKALRDEDVVTSVHADTLPGRDANRISLLNKVTFQDDHNEEGNRTLVHGDDLPSASRYSSRKSSQWESNRKPASPRSSSAMPKLPGLAHLILTDKIDGGRISFPAEQQQHQQQQQQQQQHQQQREVSEVDTDGSIPDLTEIFPPPRRKKMRQNLDRTAMMTSQASRVASTETPDSKLVFEMTHEYKAMLMNL